MQRHTKVLAGLLALSLLGAACGDDDDDTVDRRRRRTRRTSPTGPTSRIGAQDFGESLILAEIYAGALDDAGYEAEHDRGRRVPRPAVRRVRVGRHQPGARLRGVPARVPQRRGRRGDERRRRDLRRARAAARAEEDRRGPTPSDAVDTNAFVVTRRPRTSWASPRCPTWPRRVPTSRSGARRTASPTASASPACSGSTASTSRPTSLRSTPASSPRRSARAPSTSACSSRPTAGSPSRAGSSSRTTSRCWPPTTCSRSSARRSPTPTATT